MAEGTPKPQEADKPWWQDLIAAMPKWVPRIAGLGVVGTLLLAAYNTENGRRLVKVLTDKVLPEIWEGTKEQFRRLELMVYLLANAMFLIDALILTQFGRQSLHFWLWNWPNNIENRVMFGLPILLILQFLLFMPIIRLAKWLVVIGTAEGYYGDGINEGFVTRYIRTIAKLNAWHAAGFVLAVWPTYWKWPATLAFNAAMVPVWPYFTNAWKAGESEHLRRAILTGMGVATLDAALLAASASITRIPLEGLFAGQVNIGGLAMVLVFGLEGWYVWKSSTSKTRKDIAWENKSVEEIQLEQLAIRKKAVDEGRVDASSLSQLSPVATTSSAQIGQAHIMSYQEPYLYPSQRLGQPSSALPQAIGWLLFAVLLIAMAIWMTQFNAVTTTHTPMIPSGWLNDANQTRGVFGGIAVFAVLFIGVLAFLARRR